ncbi:MAG: PfkB family carbohydrate kinase [Candidatus Bathyarchaeota archaeon]|nr:PfkB family carbohydrate kinase [Candidatus Bathyarchaeota archaeon]MDW8039802.1 PfkB family carbohydrate kinase [Nitrososphaerota archaeon]
MVFDIVVVGHFCIDAISLPSRKSPYIILGGSATYVSLSAKHLGASVSVISKVGGDFPEAYLWWLSQEGINLTRVQKVEQEKTTRFELQYNSDLSKRILKLASKAPPITVGDIPNHLEAKAAHLAPIAGEIQYGVAEKLKGLVEILSLDPQGLVRVFDENGTVATKSLEDKRILELVNVYKSSKEEIEAVAGTKDLQSAIKTVHTLGVETVIVTMGAKGAILSVEGTSYEVPAYPPSRLVDPTGAGDAFMGGFLAEYVRGKEALWCACVGSAAASTVVEGIGPTSMGCESEILRRAEQLYGKGIKH